MVPRIDTAHPKTFSRVVRRRTLLAVHWMVKRMPRAFFKLLTPLLSSIARFFFKKKKHIILDNLRLAFGKEKNAQEISRIAKDCFKSFGSGMIDLIYFLDRPKKVIQNVTIEGKENLDQALARGQGAILLSAHFGNFGLMFLRIASAGYKTNCIMRRMRDEQMEQYVSDYSHQNGVVPIFALPHGQCVRDALSSLKANHVLFILLDQNYGEDGSVFVDFFGQAAATATGPVVISHRSGAPILPVFIVSAQGGQYKIIIDPPVEFQAASHEQAGVMHNTAQLTKIIEGYIRQYPCQWGGWMHRRWKTRPAGFS